MAGQKSSKKTEAKKKYTVHVLSGTHWDREWRYTAEQSKLRLAVLIDHLLDLLDREPRFKCYHLDGGSVVLDDYLSVRPENRSRLERYIREGRISLVNWYTLPETYTVAPESLIRNLMVGKRVAAPLGGSMRAGYTATSYGQTSQLPQIYRGFGIESAIFYRGTNKHACPPIFLWEGRDGSRLHVIRCFDEVTRTNWFFYVHQPVVLGKPARDLSYYYSPAGHPVHMADETLYLSDFQILSEDPSFPRDKKTLQKALDYLKEQAYPQAIGRHVLALDMEDNAKPYPLLPELIEALNRVSEDSEFVQQTMDDYVDTVINATRRKQLHVHRGEIRFTAVEPGFNALLGATHSSRVKLKLLNEEAETELALVAEPLASWASVLGWDYPRALFDRAWTLLLLNHAHDNIVGAAIDQAHEDMLPRFSAAKTVAHEVSRKACEEIWKRLDLSAFQPDDLTLTVFNTLPFNRKGVLPLVVDVPRDFDVETTGDPALGVGAVIKRTSKIPNYKFFDLVDEQGKTVEYAVLSKEKMKNRIECELDTAALIPVNRLRMLLEVDVPPMGYRTYALRPRAPQYVFHPQPGPERKLIAQPGGILENEFLKVEIQPNGTFRLTDKESKQVFEDQHLLTDNGAVGNAHLYRTPLRDFEITSLAAEAQVIGEESTPLRGVYRIDITMRIPSAVTRDCKDRLADRVDLPVSTWLTLRRGSRRLDIRTRLNNEARDHRLRVLFPTGVKSDTVAVESAFAVEQRTILWNWTGDNNEEHYPIQPMQNFVDVADGKRGLAFLSRGLREYEVMDDPRRTLAITLLRTHRAYMTSTDELSPEELEKGIRGQHSLGIIEYQYALYPHRGDWKQGKVMEQAYDHKVPVRVLQGVPKPGQLSSEGSFFRLTPEGQAQISACCQSEDGKAFILRVWNITERPVSTKLQSTLPFKNASKVRMDETVELEPLKKSGQSWSLPLRGGEIATIRLEMKNGE